MTGREWLLAVLLVAVPAIVALGLWWPDSWREVARWTRR